MSIIKFRGWSIPRRARCGAFASGAVAGVVGLIMNGCGFDAFEVGTREESPSTAVEPLSSSDAITVNRVIPIRFVQFTDTGMTPISSTVLTEHVNGVTAALGKAGLSFYVADSLTVQNSVFTSTQGGQNYTWPNPTSSAPMMVFNPTCNVSPPAGGTESEDRALFRAGSYCARDGEIIVFIVKDDLGQAQGTYPWEANAVIMQRFNFTSGHRTLAHEIGHYLGLPHSYKGAAAGYDLSNSNLKDPQTGNPAKLSDFWDLVYKPRDLPPTTTSNVYFDSRAQAAQYAESSLRPIQGNSGWTTNPLGFKCVTSLNNCPSGTVEGTLRLAVPRTNQEYSDCNTVDPAYSQNCLCVTNPSQCDILFTGNNALKGLGFQLPGHTPQNPKLGANVMSYNYSPGWVGDQFLISASQVEQIHRVLKYDIASSWHPGTTGRRPRLGVGGGSWSDWSSLGGAVLGNPAAVASGAGQLDVVVRGTDNVIYNKIQNAGSTSWWPSQTGWASIGGSLADTPVALRRGGTHLDVIGRWTDGTIRNKVWDPGLSSWWPSQSDWASSIGTATVAPTAVSWGVGRLDVFSRDGSNFLHKFWSSTNGTWSPSQTGWSNIGAPNGVSGTPTVWSWGVDRIDVFALDSNRAAYNKVWQGSWWPSATGWQTLGSRQFEETPTALSWGANRVDLFGRGTNWRGYNKVWSPSGWWPGQNDWSDIGGSLGGRISAAAWGAGRLDLVARSNDGRLLYKYWDASTSTWWPAQTEWAVLALAVGGDPVVVSSGSGKLDIFVRGSDGAVWHRSRRP